MESGWELALMGAAIAIISSCMTSLIQFLMMLREDRINWEQERQKKEMDYQRKMMDTFEGGYRVGDIVLSAEAVHTLAQTIREAQMAQDYQSHGQG